MSRASSCTRCGYSLEELPQDGQCPECGRQVRESSRYWSADGADADWLFSLSLGATLLTIVCGLAALLLLVQGEEPTPFVRTVVWATYVLAAAGGVVLTANIDSLGAFDSMRKAARWAGLGAAAAGGAHCAAPFLGLKLVGHDDVIVSVAGLLLSLTPLLTFAAVVVERLSHEHLRVQALCCAWGAGVSGSGLLTIELVFGPALRSSAFMDVQFPLLLLAAVLLSLAAAASLIWSAVVFGRVACRARWVARLRERRA